MESDELCRACWYPIDAFNRREGNEPDRVLDLTQDFFVHLLDEDVLASDPEGKGRFRSLEVADRLGMTENAVNVANSRLRRE